MLRCLSVISFGKIDPGQFRTPSPRCLARENFDNVWTLRVGILYGPLFRQLIALKQLMNWPEFRDADSEVCDRRQSAVMDLIFLDY